MLRMWPFQRPPSSEDEAVLTSPLPTSVASEASILKDSAPASSTMTSAQQRQSKMDRSEVLGYSDERLGIVFPLRAALLMGVSFLCGASLGASHGSSIAADRYRAENAHRLPTTMNGWYLYHKSKNYHATLGGMKEGAKFGSILTGWALLFMATEEIVDQSRSRLFAKQDDEQATGQRDAASTVVSAMTVAGVYSWKKGFDHYATARTARMALKYSILYGLAQDLLATFRGDQPAYINWAWTRFTRSPTNQDDV